MLRWATLVKIKVALFFVRLIHNDFWFQTELKKIYKIFLTLLWTIRITESRLYLMFQFGLHNYAFYVHILTTVFFETIYK